MLLIMKHAESVHFTTSLIALFKKRRKELEMSHLKLAEKCGVSRMAISHIEAGKRIPTIATCYKIAKALDLKLSDVVKKVE
ncbi:MAG TPA: XRE family transcriptional regulator [Alphaproteobacteria bacterium]|nr:XRE family transcriptional regulator [Alphaproteobacteria bacterium]